MRTLTAGVLAGVVAAFGAPTYAATFVVNSVNDIVDVMPGDGICATRSGVCTLRAAIQEANALAGGDSITLPAGSFLLTSGGRDEDAAAMGDLDVTDDLVISGAGEGSTTVSGYSSDRVFDVYAPATVTLANLTIADGLPAPEEAGGGMVNRGTVILTHVTFVGNRAGRGIDGGSAAGDGGGLENLGSATLTHVTFSRNHAGNAGPSDSAGSAGGMLNAGTATLRDVTFSGNQAGAGDPIPFTLHEGGSGGGMVNDGMATLTDVSFSANRAGNGGFDGGGGVGGGMLNQGSAALSNVSFSGNFAGDGGSNEEEDGGFGGGGGGLENYSGPATLTNVSFSQNRAGDGGSGGPGSTGGAGGSGGGMDNQASATLIDVTFDRNRAGDGNGDVGGSGGGLANGANVTLTNVTVFSNQAGNGNGIDATGGNGGGIDNQGSATLTNVTIALNSAGSGAFGGADGKGDQLGADASINLRNTIVSGPGQNCSDADSVLSLGHNIDSGTTCGFAAGGDRSATDPVLGPLKSNGGFSQTMTLLPGSPAIDAGDATNCPPTDARGVTRPQGTGCDIGAFEVEAPPPAASSTATPTQSTALTQTAPPTPTPTDTNTLTPTETEPPTQMPTTSVAATPVATATATETVTPTLTPTQRCVGDCNGDDSVAPAELITLVNIALGNAPVTDCMPAAVNGAATVTVRDILAAVNDALDGCGGSADAAPVRAMQRRGAASSTS